MRHLLALLLVVGLAAVACGSGEDAPQPTGTESSQRAERGATVTQQEVEQQPVEVELVQQVQQTEQAEQAGQEPEQPQQVQVEEEDIDAEPEVDSLPTEIVGTHKEVRSEGRVLGEPDAPVLIEHFGDFT